MSSDEVYGFAVLWDDEDRLYHMETRAVWHHRVGTFCHHDSHLGRRCPDLFMAEKDAKRCMRSLVFDHEMLAYVRGTHGVVDMRDSWFADKAEIVALYDPNHAGFDYWLMRHVKALVPAMSLVMLVLIVLLMFGVGGLEGAIPMLAALLGGVGMMVHITTKGMVLKFDKQKARKPMAEFDGLKVYRSASAFAEAIGRPEIKKELKNVWSH